VCGQSSTSTQSEYFGAALAVLQRAQHAVPLGFAPRSSRESLAGAAEARLEAEHTELCESPGNFRRLRPIYYKGRSKRGNPILSGILPYAQHRAS